MDSFFNIDLSLTINFKKMTVVCVVNKPVEDRIRIKLKKMMLHQVPKGQSIATCGDYSEVELPANASVYGITLPYRPVHFIQVGMDRYSSMNVHGEMYYKPVAIDDTLWFSLLRPRTTRRPRRPGWMKVELSYERESWEDRARRTWKEETCPQ